MYNYKNRVLACFQTRPNDSAFKYNTAKSLSPPPPTPMMNWCAGRGECKVYQSSPGVWHTPHNTR